MTKQTPATKQSRPHLPKLSEAMKAWSAGLSMEVGGWPDVAARPMFGLTALYRHDQIFAALPRTRAMETPNSLAFKLEKAGPRILARIRRDPRIGVTQMQKARWFTFELTSDADLHQALEWLARAYEAAHVKTVATV
jgi:hypothetical protein